MGNNAPDDTPESTSGSSSESEESEEDNSLYKVLSDNMIKSEFDKTRHKFMPRRFIERHLDRTTILKAMDIQKPTRKDERLVAYIIQRATKAFAITAYVGLENDGKLRKAMLLFMDKDFDDTKLPVEDPDETQQSGSTSARISLASLEEGKPKIWIRKRPMDFYNDQWKFLVPVLSMAIPNHDFEEALILPFISKHAEFGQGAFGMVSKYAIHEDHIVGDVDSVRADRRSSKPYC